MRKLRSKSGETLAEVLVAILVVAVSASLFLGMVAVSARINRQAVKADARFYKAMSLLERFEAEEGAVEQRSGSLRVEGSGVSEELPVTVFYGDDMVSYQLDGGAGT